MKTVKKIFQKYTRSLAAIIATVIFVLAIAGIGLVGYLISGGLRLLYSFLCVSAVFTALCLLFICIIVPRFRINIDENDDSEISSDVPVSLYNNIEIPVALSSENGTILWGNKAFGNLFKSSGCANRLIESLLGCTMENVVNSGENGFNWESSGEKYNVKIHPTASSQYVIIFNNITALTDAMKRLSDEAPLLAFIVLDNIEEIAQIDPSFAASASAKVNSYLNEWAESVEGSIKEYERNKYMFIFRSEHLNGFLEEQFSILDKIRSIGKRESGEASEKGELIVTVSIGIGAVGGSLAEKERASRAAIELALARGGDQAVLKTEAGVQYYGGMTKTSQKRSTVKSRIIAERLTSLIESSSAVFIMGHRFADFDAFGACVGMARISMHLGKKCYVLRSTHNYNLSKCFEVFGNVDEYDKIIISGEEAKTLKNSENPLLIIVDVNNTPNFEYPEIADTFPRRIIIDHHRMADEFKIKPLLSYIEPSSSSTCELICEILDQAFPDVKLRKEEADVMLAGIMLDTKKFILNTGVRTFAAAQYLRGQGAEPSRAQEYFKSDMDAMRREAKFESKIQIYQGVIAISISDDPCDDLDRVPAAKAADNMLTIDGILASFAVYRLVSGDRDSVVINARSTGLINVQLIMEKLGGGGHFDQAATSSALPIAKVVTLLKEAIDDYLADNPALLSKAK